jgi:hypothetical protein
LRLPRARRDKIVGPAVAHHADALYRQQHGEGLPDRVVEAGVADLLEEDRVGLAQNVDLGAGDFAGDADCEPRAGDRVALDEPVGQSQLASMQQARGNCAAAVSIARACSTVMIPSALVNEKCVSPFEFSRIKPSPSSRSGGSTIGKTLVHSSVSALDPRGRPVSANAAISPRCGSNASARLSPKRRLARSTTRTRWPWTALMADKTRIRRSRLLGLVGR